MALDETANQIGTLNEKPLHAVLKEWYARPGDQMEVALDGYVIDIIRDDLLIEIQTRNFSALKRKMRRLTEAHHVRLVHPIAVEKWIVKLPRDSQSKQSRRKSPKRGGPELIFDELVSFPQLIASPNFSLEVLLVQEEEVRRYDARRAWRRRGWVTSERRLLGVVERHVFETTSDLGALIPPAVQELFTTSDLASALKRPRRLAQKMAYCLREMGAITPQGKRGNAILYSRAER